MSRVISYLKAVLPPRLSYRLRVAKALWVDKELQSLRAICKTVRADGAVAIDVGANVGIYAAVMSRYFNQVFCVEPNPVCIKYLKAVLPKNCVLLEYAISLDEGTAELSVPTKNNELATVLGTISPRNTLTSAGSDMKKILVKTTSLDALLARIRQQIKGQIVLLKVDVEGHEFEVFQGAKGLLTSDRPLIVAELEDRHGTPVQEVVRFLAGHRYRASSIKSGGFFPQPTGGLEPMGNHPVNYIFKPS